MGLVLPRWLIATVDEFGWIVVGEYRLNFRVHPAHEDGDSAVDQNLQDQPLDQIVEELQSDGAD